MARANATHVFARVERSGLSFGNLVRQMPNLQRFKDQEPLLRRCVLAALILFVVSLVGATAILTMQSRDDVIADAIDDLDMLSSTLSRTVQVGSRDEPNAGKLLRSLVPARFFARGRQIYLSDQAGIIVASLPTVATQRTISDLFEVGDPLTVLGEKAGAMRTTSADGADVIAGVRSLTGRVGQLVLIHPVADLLSDWRGSARRAALLLGATALLLVSVGTAYWWQANRSARAEIVADELKQRIDTALSRGRCGLWDWDIARGRIYWSPSMFQILGMETRPDASFLSFGELAELVHPADGDFLAIAEDVAAAGTRAIDRVFRIRGSRGEWVWLRARAEIVQGSKGNGAHLVGIAVDVTEQRDLAERTAMQDARLRDAIETISEAFVLWDADNRLALCNSKFRSLHGIPRDAGIVGLAYAKVMASGALPSVRAQVALGERADSTGNTYEAQLADGRWLQVNERRTSDGGYVSVGTDITALKLHEGQLMDSERRLMSSVADLRRHKQMLEYKTRELGLLAERYLEEKANAEQASRAKSEFLANMSHELRTPLNAILGFSEMMQAQVFGPLGSNRYLEYCDYIRDSGEKLLGVITDVLDMSRLDAGQMVVERSTFAMTDILVEALRGIGAAAASKRIAVDEDVMSPVVCLGDPSAVARSVTTVLRNAVKFTPEDGRIAVRLRDAARGCVVTIADTGCGVPADCITRIGRPFEQFAPHMQDGMKGSGLGLAIASSLVRLHGGDLRIRSREGKGTVVRIRLPTRAA